MEQITAVNVLLVIILGISGHLIQRKMQAYDKHLEECAEKSVNHARLEEQLSALKSLCETNFKHLSERIDNLPKHYSE